MLAKKSSGSLARLALIVSVLLLGALFYVYWRYKSQLALAQAADSLLDVFTASVLAWTIKVGMQPQDEEHPFGHSRAEPIGALITAIVAGILAIEVLRSAVAAIYSGSQPTLMWPLVVAFGTKSLLKLGVMLYGRKLLSRSNSPAVKALVVDSRNDVLVSGLAVGGFFAARYGWGGLDAWLALPVALWIGYSGYDLLRDNLRLLMGEAPPVARQRELVAMAGKIDGVVDAHDLRAHYLGTHLQVHVHIVVPEQMTVIQAHDIGENVRRKLEAEDDVGTCSVHIDIE